jgi:3-deoxy-7-phosphoheptulonate synthase
MGNETAHIILRGGKVVLTIRKMILKKPARFLKIKNCLLEVMVDFSHANSQKKYKNQLKVGEILLPK